MLSNSRKKVISFTTKFSIIQRSIVNKTLSKSRRTTISFDHNEKKKELKDEMMIVISSRVFDINSFEKR